jgi:hypothetical protein
MTDPVTTWLGHIRYLTEVIGPRGSTTPGERLGAAYCQQVLQSLGFDARLETFTSARSIFQPHLLASLGFLIAFAVYPLAGWVSAAFAALLSLVTLASQLLELSFRDNPLRRLIARGPSQNTVTVLPPAGKHTRDLVLIGHVDTQRTPLFFSSPRWVTAYENFTTIAFVAFAAQVVLYSLGEFTQWSWIWPASAAPALCAMLLAALCLQAESTPHNVGANDNASAVGILLTLASRLRAEPLQRTRVWFVCTGCEEVQHYGAVDFFRRHRQALVRPVAIAYEMLGCAGPAWLTQEGIVVPFQASPALVRLAGCLAQEHPEWGAYPSRIVGGNTEMADALMAGVPAITLTGLTPRGKAPYWHQAGDTFDKINPEILARAFAFSEAYIRALDRQEDWPELN